MFFIVGMTIYNMMMLTTKIILWLWQNHWKSSQILWISWVMMLIVCCTRLSINFDDKPYCFPESTTSPAELTKRFGQTMKHAGIKKLWKMQVSNNLFSLWSMSPKHKLGINVMSAKCLYWSKWAMMTQVANVSLLLVCQQIQIHDYLCTGVAVSVTTFTDVIAFLVSLRRRQHNHHSHCVFTISPPREISYQW